MRVLHIQKVKGVGGSERHLLTLLPALASKGVEVRMCVLAMGSHDVFLHELEQHGVDFVTLAAGADVNPILLPRVVTEIRRFMPDLVHTHLVHGDAYGQVAARLAGAPAVSSVHGTKSLRRRLPYSLPIHFAGSLAQRTIAISDHVARLINEIRLTSPSRVRIVRYGISVANWSSPDQGRSGRRERFGVQPNEVVVGVASRMVPDKGHHFLLEAVSEARKKLSNLRLLVAGVGPLRGELEDRAIGLCGPGTVHFLGHVSSMSQFMDVCDLLAFPTLPELGEGFGLAALEAMAAGRPVIATAIDSLPEIVIHKQTGFLVTPGSVAELATRLVELGENAALRRELGSQGRQRAEQEFSLDQMTEKTISVYREVLSG